MASKARSSSPPNSDLLIFATEVTSAASALRRQISHLAPSLRYQRDKIDRFSIEELVRDICEHFASRGGAERVRFSIEAKADFKVRSNRGRLTQVIDNMLLNSEYWLKQASARIEGDLVVHFEIEAPRVRVWDNGLGVDASVEDTLFEPFITLKPKGQGRGLGLFISAQILESMGCSVSLLGARNARGYRYIFELDLAGIANG